LLASIKIMVASHVGRLMDLEFSTHYPSKTLFTEVILKYK